MEFSTFKRRLAEDDLPEDAYSYDVEQDFWKWEEAETLKAHYRAGAGRMDVERFLHALLEVLKDRPFVQSVDLDTEAVIVRGRVLPRGGSIPAGLFQ